MEQAKGHCKHGEFILAEGCPQCIADRMAEEGNTEASIAEAVKEANEKHTGIIIVCSGGCGRTTEGMETLQGEFKQVGESGVPEWTCPDCLIKKPQQPGPAAETAIVKIAPDKDEGYIKLLAETTKLLEYSTKLVIKGPEDKKGATNDLIIMGEVSKKIEVMKKEWLAPIDAHRKAVFTMFQQVSEPLAQAVRQTKAAMLSFDQKQERIRREQEAINREKQALAEREAAVSGKPVEPVELVEVAPEVSTTTRTDLGSVSQRENWKYEVEDFAALPDEFKLPDTIMLNSIAKKYHDKKQVPGVRFYNDPIMTRRAS